MSDIVIRAEGLGKRYRRGLTGPPETLRDALTRVVGSPLAAIRRPNQEYFWALHDVALDVRHGEVLGLIGRNGAGKTTLLKILSRITRPTTGWAQIHGRVRSLLEVGTGFHGELSGRENTYLSGSILGMGKREIDRKFDEIVAFAEIDKFIDTPVKHYSSGMYVRLAFAVAAHLQPEILLVDEVLAVGDINFQKKCLGKMGDVARQGRTIVLVTHQLNQIRRLCHRAIWIDAGSVRLDGNTHQVAAAYESEMSRGAGAADQPRAGNTKARFLGWEIVPSHLEDPGENPADPPEDRSHVLSTTDPVTIKFTIEVREPVRGAHHGIALRNVDNLLIWAWAANDLNLDPGLHELRYRFPALHVRPGPYSWQVSLYEGETLVDSWNCLPEMLVATETYQHERDEWNGILNVPCQFTIQEAADVAK